MPDVTASGTLQVLMQQEMALDALFLQMSRSGDYSLGESQFRQWLDQTRQMIAACGEVQCSHRFIFAHSWPTSVRFPAGYFTRKVERFRATIGALGQHLREDRLVGNEYTWMFGGISARQVLSAFHERLENFRLTEAFYEMHEDENSARYDFEHCVFQCLYTFDTLTDSNLSQQMIDALSKCMNLNSEIAAAISFLEETMVRFRTLHHIDTSKGENDPMPDATSNRPQPSSSVTKTRSKPRMFIGSSREGVHIAEMLQLGLYNDVNCVLWSQGVFGLTEGTLESLVKCKDDFDFAVLVLTPDDVTTKRDKDGNTPRDNVLFELGFFIGALGRDRTFMVYCSQDHLELPSDLAGVTAATYQRQADENFENLQAELGVACTKLKIAIRTAQKKEKN